MIGLNAQYIHQTYVHWQYHVPFWFNFESGELHHQLPNETEENGEVCRIFLFMHMNDLDDRH